jgi:hypothetical protein
MATAESSPSGHTITTDPATIAGDPFKAAGSPRSLAQLRYLEERLAHEFVDDEERQELRDRVLALRRRLGL